MTSTDRGALRIEPVCPDNQFQADLLHEYINDIVLEAREIDPNGADYVQLKNMALDTMLRVMWPAGNA